MAFGPDGTAYAVWYEPASGDADIWFATLAPGSSTWSANTKISDDPGTGFQGDPQIAVDGAGNVTAIWSDWRTSPAQLRVRQRPAGSSTWSPSVVIASDGANEPSLSVRSDGRAVVAWYDGFNSTTATLWASEYDPAAGTWAAPQQVSDPSATDSNSTPGASIGTSGLVIVWTHHHDLAGGGRDSDISAKTKSFSGGGTDTFTNGYDRLSRLTTTTGPDGNRSYAYDPVGNRASKVADTTTSYTYDRADRMTAAGASAISINAVGATTARGSDTFTYDQANRMITATVAGVTETFAYDGDGVRFSRQVGTGPVTRYVSDINTSLPVTIDDGSRRYVWGIGLAYAVAGSAIEVYHTDRLGSVRAITDAAGAVTATWRTDEFGVETATTGTSTQPYGFTGEPKDASGLSYLRARYYDPALARFMTRDRWQGTASTPCTLNRYSYVQNNPVTFSDPSGLRLTNAVGAGVKCGYATVMVVGEVGYAAISGNAVGALLAGGAAVPGVNITLAGVAIFSGLLAIINYEHTQQSIQYCFGTGPYPTGVSTTEKVPPVQYPPGGGPAPAPAPPPVRPVP